MTRLAALQQQWVGTTGRMPTPEQQARMVSAELDRDMLFQRAVELELAKRSLDDEEQEQAEGGSQ